jgi:hypothetical protein
MKIILKAIILTKNLILLEIISTIIKMDSTAKLINKMGIKIANNYRMKDLQKRN